MISAKMVLACSLFALGQMLAWFQINSQFVWDWWADKPILTVAIYSIPASLCFWYGVRIAYSEMNEIWGPRFLIFGLSYVTFPFLTWYFLHESPFTPRTMMCVLLSFVIIGIQLLWR